MAHVIADRVQETSTTTGTGALSLGGAHTGFRDFDSVMADGDTCFYCAYAVDGNGNPSGAWETGLGTFADTDTLNRTTVLASSNSGSAVNFGAGNKYVFLTAAASSLFYTISTQTGTSYTAAIADMNDYVRFTNGSAITFTVPPNSDVAFPIGTRIFFEQGGAGTVTVAEGSGVTVNSPDALVETAAQYSVASLVKVATDTWTLSGDLA